jgi:hypothetical protein
VEGTTLALVDPLQSFEWVQQLVRAHLLVAMAIAAAAAYHREGLVAHTFVRIAWS